MGGSEQIQAMPMQPVANYRHGMDPHEDMRAQAARKQTPSFGMTNGVAANSGWKTGALGSDNLAISQRSQVGLPQHITHHTPMLTTTPRNTVAGAYTPALPPPPPVESNPQLQRPNVVMSNILPEPMHAGPVLNYEGVREKQNLLRSTVPVPNGAPVGLAPQAVVS